MNVEVSSWGSMLNGITNNGILNTQLDKNSEVFGVATNPIKNPYQNVDKGLFIDETSISREAFQMYQKDLDVKNFTNLALSDPEDTSHNDIVKNLINFNFFIFTL